MSEIDSLFSLLESTNEDAWSKVLFDIALSHGFNQTIYGVVPNKKQPLENAFLQSNYSPEWRSIYDREKLHYIDPTVSHCLKSTVPLVWQPDTFIGHVQKQFYEEACKHGLYTGISFPIHGPNGEFGLLCFVWDGLLGRAFELELNHVHAKLALLRDFVFESSVRFVSSIPDKNQIHLTDRELECLKWAMVGKSSWEISMILNRSEATINFHISNIKQKFQVGTRQHAIVKAISIGLLVP